MSDSSTAEANPQRRGRPSNREALIEGAIQCIRDKGYGATTTRDIAAAADANLASIGYHFGSKDELLGTAVLRAFYEWFTRVAAVALEQTEATPWARLRQALIAWREGLEANRPFIVGYLEAIAISSRSEQLRAEIAATYETARGAVATIIQQGFADDSGESPPFDVDVIAGVLFAVVDGLMIQWLEDPDAVSDGSKLMSSVELAVRAAGSFLD